MIVKRRVIPTGAGYTQLSATRTDITDLDELADMLDVPGPEQWGEWIAESEEVSYEGGAAYDGAIEEGLTEEEAEKARDAAEQQASDEIYENYANALVSTVNHFFGEHGLTVVPVRPHVAIPFEYRIVPEKSWSDAAEAIIDTINGVGTFHFSSLQDFMDSGPYTAKQAVLKHLHWIQARSKVYGGSSPRAYFDRQLR